MKINQALPAQGSFGLTPEMKEQVANYQETRRALPSEDEEQEMTAAQAEEELQEPVDEAADSDHDERPSLVDNPLDNLSKIGVELSDDDFTKIVFRGYLEKDIVVVPSIRGTRPLIATFRTLIGKELDEVDELLAEEIQDTKMTNDGYQTRRSMLIISYGVSQLMGKAVCNPVVGKDGKVNSKATARGRRKVLSALNPGILTKMMHIHGIFTVSINAIIANPEADYLKKS